MKSILLICPREEHPKRDRPTPEHATRIANALSINVSEIETVFAPNAQYPNFKQYKMIIISGSKYSVNDHLSWIPVLEEKIREIEKADIPLFGICFGHQIIVKALGGEVKKGHELEIGIHSVTPSEHGEADFLFATCDTEVPVIQIHGDHVAQLPNKPEVKILASNDNYAIQAIAIGERIRSVQFHPEMNHETLEHILTRDKNNHHDNNFLTHEQTNNILAKLKTAKKASATPLQNFYHKFK